MSVQLNLATANRYRDQLLTASKKKRTVRRRSYGATAEEADVTAVEVSKLWQTHRGVDASVLQPLVEALMAKTRQEQEVLEAYASDYQKLKRAIIETNRSAGVEELLLELKDKTALQQKIKNRLSELENDNVYSLEEFLTLVQSHKDLALTTQVAASVALYNAEELNAELKQVTRELEKLRLRINILNASTKLEFEFSSASKEFLGL